MAKKDVKPNEEEVEVIEDDGFDSDGDGDVDMDVDVDVDVDVDDLDDEDLDDDGEEEEVKASKRGKSSAKDEVKELNYEEAVRVNPKRASALKKRASLVESILEGAKLIEEEDVQKAWKALNEQVDTAKSRKYTLKEDFDTNEVIQHKSFGVGFVNQKLSPTKIEVVFEDGMRRLTCNR